MISFNVDTDYRLEDLRALETAARRRALRAAGDAYRLVLRLMPAGFALLFVAGLALQPGAGAQVAWACGGALVLAYLAAVGIVARRGHRPKPNGIFLGHAHFEFGADGIAITRRFSHGHLAWPQVLAIDVTSTHLFLWIDTAIGHVIPLRDLPPPMTGAEAAERVRAFIAAAPRDADADARAGSAGVAVENEMAPVPAESTSAWRELGAIARALVLRDFDAARIAGRDAAFLLLGALLLALWVPLDPLVYPGELELDWYALPGLVWVIAGTCALAWLLARLARPRIEYRRVLLLTLGALPIAMLGSLAFGLLSDVWFFPLVCLFAAYGAAYFARALRRISGAPQFSAIVAGAVCTYLFVLAGNALDVNPGLWVYAEEPAEDSADATTDDDEVWARVAALQFGQQARIDADLARIAAHATSQPEVFFLGFAGNGRQRVFAEEIGLAARVVGTRYHAGEREMLLVNDARDLERRPFATPEAMRHALIGIGKLMDPDDVLFLALSSHGGEDATLEVANAGMVPVSLGAQELDDMLREAKIPRKVIVISACYAGGFVPLLADENTTVITAAASDRTSFGCADDRDLTYFGEAFYRDALPGATTLAAAFETARRAIAAREQQEGVEPSEPQARFGSLVERRLEQDAAGQGR